MGSNNRQQIHRASKTPPTIPKQYVSLTYWQDDFGNQGRIFAPWPEDKVKLMIVLFWRSKKGFHETKRYNHEESLAITMKEWRCIVNTRHYWNGKLWERKGGGYAIDDKHKQYYEVEHDIHQFSLPNFVAYLIKRGYDIYFQTRAEAVMNPDPFKLQRP